MNHFTIKKNKIMKKLSLILCFAVTASMAFAQFPVVTVNTAEIEQNGTGHTANVSQLDGNANYANVLQTGLNGVEAGANNYIDIVSKGSSNKVDVDQLGVELNAASKPILKGYVKQTGDNNEATLTQKGDHIDGMIEQTGLTEGAKGMNNVAVWKQTGSYLQIESKGLLQKGTENNAQLTQIGGVNVSLDVVQAGHDNHLTSLQDGTSNQFSAFQTGEDNKAFITQLGANNYSDFWSTTQNKLTQTGNDNSATLTEHGNSNFQVQQIGGDFNKVGLDQTGSVAYVLQNGNSNTIAGLTSDIATFGTGTSLDATQLGDNNKLYVSTAGNLTTLQNNVGSTKTGNEITYEQTAVGITALTQIGDKNLIWLKNTSSLSPMDVDVDQNGDGNIVGKTFVGGLATASANFEGNHLDIDQTGNFNKLNLDSTTAHASVDVMQNGSNNWASVIQH